VNNDYSVTETLTQLVSQKHDILKRLGDLARRQQESIREGGTQRLMRVLSAKQTLMTELQKVQRALTPFHQDNPDERKWRSSEARRQCRDMVEQCETLLAQLMNLERQCEAELRERRDATEAQLHESHDSATATRAYLRMPTPARSALDLSSDS